MEGKLSPLQALFSPPGLQQMQQFLQQVANNGSAAAAAATGATGPGTGVPGFNPAQLHHLMQQQQTFLSHHQVSGFSKLYIPSTIKTLLMFLHTKWGLVCSKIINHGLNYGLFSLPFMPIFYLPKLLF